MNNKRISVIMPMYNAADTIEECLDSIINQTIFNTMEIVIVDDASTDSSILKVSSYESCFPEQIVLICLEKNRGPGYARNVAMDYASGDYIGYVDADDAIVPTMYEHLYEEALKTDADIVDGGYYDQNNDEAIIFTSDDLIGVLDDEKRSRLIVSGGYNVTKLFKKKFLIENNIVFRNAYVLEDMDYLIELFAKAKSISNVKEIMYVYRSSFQSLSKTMETEKYIESTTSAMVAIYERTSGISYYNRIQEACEYAMIQLYSYSINKALNAYMSGDKDKAWLISMLMRMEKIKKRIISGDYSNRFVREKIDPYDIRLMEINDRFDISKDKAVTIMLQ